MDVIESLRGIAARARAAAEEQGAETQVVITKTGIRVAAIVKGGLVQSKREIPWERVLNGSELEREAQSLIDEAIEHSRVKSAEEAS